MNIQLAMESVDSGVKERIAWAAGFFDGEGSVSLICNKRGFWYIMIQLANEHKGSVDTFCETVGTGKVYLRGDGLFHWIAVAKKAELGLSRLVGYLILKKEQAELALKSLRFIRDSDVPRLIEMAARIRALNSKGPRYWERFRINSLNTRITRKREPDG